MLRPEIAAFAPIPVVSLAALSIAWICEKARVCDEFVLFGRILAPKAVAAALWILFVCYALHDVPVGEVNGWVVCGYLVFLCENIAFIRAVFDAARQCASMRECYAKFERSVLSRGEEPSQRNFNRAVREALGAGLAQDVNRAEYLAAKCRKFAKRLGLNWEG